MRVILDAAYAEGVSEISRHYHDCHQLIYIKKGAPCVRVAGRRYSAEPGSLFLISRFEEHAITADSGEYHRYRLRIAPSIDPVQDSELSQLYPLVVNRPKDFSHKILIRKNAAELEATLQAICRETKSDRYGETMLDLLFKQLLVYILRNVPTAVIPDGTGNPELINRVKRLFEAEYEKEYTLESVARQFHISPYYLSHLFKSVTGCSVMNYLACCRIAQAKNRLIQTDLPVKQIIVECGFSDSSNFGRLFKKSVGLSAREFRNRYRPS